MYSLINPDQEYKHEEIWDYVYERDNGNCQICGKNNGSQEHHVIPKSRGGKTKTNNLILLCIDHHTGSGHGFTAEEIVEMQIKIKRNERKFRRNII